MNSARCLAPSASERIMVAVAVAVIGLGQPSESSRSWIDKDGVAGALIHQA
jgi:hypothetical protein